MPRKPKYTKEEIAEYGLQIVKKQGIEKLTARELAKVLGTTVAPIFVYYPTMDDLKEDVRILAEKEYRDYIQRGLSEKIPLLGVGMQFIQFAKKEPELYRLLFLSEHMTDKGKSYCVMDELAYTQTLVRESVQSFYDMDELAANHYFRDMWFVAHSLATLLVTGGCTYTEAEIRSIFTEISISICKAYKEVPGLIEGKYNRDAIFKELVNKKSS